MLTIERMYELADRAAKIHRKLVTFVETLQTLGNQLGKARESWDKAMNQLVSGRANLIQQANDFERLGVPVQGALPEALVARAALELEHQPASQLNLAEESAPE